LGEKQSGSNEKRRGLYCHECENFWRKQSGPNSAVKDRHPRRKNGTEPTQAFWKAWTAAKREGSPRAKWAKPISRSWGGRKAGCGRHSSGKPGFSGQCRNLATAPLIRNKRLTAADWGAALLTGEKQLL